MAYLQQNGGKLARYPGGFWMQPGIKGHAIHRGAITPEIYFSTPTIRALLQAAVVKASAFKQNAAGLFPVEIELADGKKTADAGPLSV
ncbi:MAG: hypothetical protein E6R03_10895 [Hyphomicrobiaceae bacterium]|nr:MAG: hypothetical protein E6R03_10895 [Hyphomicrobiaceae bacterium]